MGSTGLRSSSCGRDGRSCPEEVMVAAVPATPEEGAATWMHALTRYGATHGIIYEPPSSPGMAEQGTPAGQRASELWAMQQTANETALDFADRVQRLAEKRTLRLDVTMGAI